MPAGCNLAGLAGGKGNFEVSAGIVQILDAHGPDDIASFCSIFGRIVKIGCLYFYVPP